jgi:hypothetical protein
MTAHRRRKIEALESAELWGHVPNGTVARARLEAATQERVAAVDLLMALAKSTFDARAVEHLTRAAKLIAAGAHRGGR